MLTIQLIQNVCQAIQSAILEHPIPSSRLICPCIIYWYSKTRVTEIWSILFYLNQIKFQQNT